MPKIKKKTSQGISFHRHFQPPTALQRKKAMGSFPCQSEAKISREKMLQRCQQRHVPIYYLLKTRDELRSIQIPLNHIHVLSIFA
mmetsp:Transcript_11212/g.16312  ORF Transcript_11212/g.16312 Transcript_11212/m.16312 type:complete len:85 (-) Transcript_11212:236-490(-)